MSASNSVLDGASACAPTDDDHAWRDFVAAMRPGGLTERELLALCEQTVRALAVAEGFDEVHQQLPRVLRRWRALRAEQQDLQPLPSPYATTSRGRSVSPWSGLPRGACTPSPSPTPFAPSATSTHSRRSRTPAASTCLTEDEYKKELEGGFTTEPSSTAKPTFSSKKPLREHTHVARGITPDGAHTPVRHGTGKACSRSVSPANSRRSAYGDDLPPYVPAAGQTPMRKALNSSVRKLFTSPKSPQDTFDRVMTWSSTTAGSAAPEEVPQTRRGRGTVRQPVAATSTGHDGKPRPSRSPNAQRLKASVGGASVLLSPDAKTASPFSSRVRRYAGHPAERTGAVSLMFG